MEYIIGIIKDVQTKPKGCFVVKNCDLYITNKRIVCIVMGASVFVSGMIGQAIGGVPGAIGFSEDAKNKVNDKRLENIDKALDEMIVSNEYSYDIKFDDINKNKSTYKTGFWSTLGIFAHLKIVDSNGKVYRFNTPNNTKEISKDILKEATTRIAIS